MYLKRALQARVIVWLTRHLFNNVTVDDIIQLKPTGVYLGEKKLTRDEIDFVKTEADKLRTSYLWKRILRNRIRWVSNERMFKKGLVENDFIFGRAMLHNLEIIEKLLIALSKLK